MVAGQEARCSMQSCSMATRQHMERLLHKWQCLLLVCPQAWAKNHGNLVQSRTAQHGKLPATFGLIDITLELTVKTSLSHKAHLPRRLFNLSVKCSCLTCHEVEACISCLIPNQPLLVPVQAILLFGFLIETCHTLVE